MVDKLLNIVKIRSTIMKNKTSEKSLEIGILGSGIAPPPC